MSREVNLTIDGIDIWMDNGTTILDAAESIGVEIPTLCYFKHTTPNGLCRLCVVESDQARGQQAACVTQTVDGSSIRTRSPEIDRTRRTILEMLASSVDLSESQELLQLLKQYECDPNRFEGVRRDPELIDDNPMFIRDYAQCVLCWRCVQVCAEDAQYSFAINFSGRGFHTSISTFFEKPLTKTTCVFCGQCVGVCPTGALKGKQEFLIEQGFSPEEIFNRTRQSRKRT